MEPFWTTTEGSGLRQGDYLPGCLVSEMDPMREANNEIVARVDEYDVIILTQSCDLEHQPARLVAVCPIYCIETFEESNEQFRRRGRWEEVRKGRVEGLHLLASPEEPDNNRRSLVVDFREVFSLPYSYLNMHASQLGKRWRLKSPFLEHYSQAFARFYMRVGLPSGIAPFK